MLIQWLTFAVMILIQCVMAVWVVSAIQTTLATQGREIQALRDWREQSTPKMVALDEHERKIEDHETRIRVVEKMYPRCEAEDCPMKG